MKKLMLITLALCLLVLGACSGDMENTESGGTSMDNTKPNSAENSLFPQESLDMAIQTFLDGRFEGRGKVKLVALGDSIARG